MDTPAIGRKVWTVKLMLRHRLVSDQGEHLLWFGHFLPTTLCF